MKLFLLTFLSLIGFASYVEATAYPMICRGGPGMHSTTNHMILNNQVTAKIGIYFKRGQTPRNPQPGECVWLDRAIRPDEPNLLSYYAFGSQAFLATGSGFGPGTGPLKYLLEGVGRLKIFYVHAEQIHVPTFDAYFKVTRLGP